MLKCIECSKKVNEIFAQNDTFEGIKLAEEIDNIYFLPYNCDIEAEKMEVINLDEMLTWIKKHSAHSKIAFEVGI